MARMSDYITLHDVLAFRDLRHEEIDEIEAVAEEKSYKPNEFICREGDPGDCLYVVKSGQVRIVKITSMGTEKVLSRLGPRCFFGEMSLIDAQPRSACAIADVVSKMYCIYKTDMDRLLKDNSIAALKVIHGFARTMSYRLRKMNEELVRIFSDPDRTIREIAESEEKLMRYFLISGWYYEGPE